jgi:hypothetical protein
MSRLKLKVNNCLLNNKEFFKLFNSIFNKTGYNCFLIFQDYLNIKILKYDENFEILWNFWVLKFYIFFLILKFWNLLKLLKFNFFLENFDPLPMVYRPPYPWNIDPPTHGISTPPTYGILTPPAHGILNPLPMVPFISTPLSMVFWSPYTWYFDLPAYLLIRNGGVQFTIQGGFSFQ